MCIIFKSLEVLQFPHKSYLQKGYFSFVFMSLLKESTSFYLDCKEIYQIKKKRNRHDITEILLILHGVLNTIKQTNKHENVGNVRFIMRNYEILYKEKSQWHDTFWHAWNYMHVDFDWPRKNTLNSCYNVQFSISWQYLTSELQKVQEFLI